MSTKVDEYTNKGNGVGCRDEDFFLCFICAIMVVLPINANITLKMCSEFFSGLWQTLQNIFNLLSAVTV